MTLMLFSSQMNLSENLTLLLADLFFIEEFLKINRLSLNLKKIVYGTFSRDENKFRCKSKFNYVNEICAYWTERPHVKYLGLVLDGFLWFDYHIVSVFTKVAQRSGTLKKFKSFKSSEILLIIYYASIHPHFKYIVGEWGSDTGVAC